MLDGARASAERAGAAVQKAERTAAAAEDLATRAKEDMPTAACRYFYDCKGCGVVVLPRQVDRCVFCSYGDVKCPPVQAGECGC